MVHSMACPNVRRTARGRSDLAVAAVDNGVPRLPVDGKRRAITYNSTRLEVQLGVP